MKNQRNHARDHVGLALSLVALLGAASLILEKTGRASAQAPGLNTWSSNGPKGGPVLAIAIDRSSPATIYAGTPTGVFKSTNGGGTWLSSLTNAYVRIVAIAPTTPTTLYAATNGGIYKSFDGGSSWNAMNNGLENQNGPIPVLALAIDPTNSNTIYAAGPDIEVGGPYKAIYKSTNGSGSWSITKHSVNSTAVHYTLAIDPVNPNIIYAAGSVNGGGVVWKSTDNGRIWSIVNVGLSSTVYALTIDPTNTNVIYAGTAGQSVFKSSDGGATWSEFNDGLPFYSTVSSIVIDPLNPNIVHAGTYGGVFKSSNGGSWSALNGGLTNLGVNALAIDPGSTNILYTGTQGGAFKSTSNGANWIVSNEGLPGINSWSLALNPGNADVYAGTDGGTFSSNDNGGNWVGRDFYPLAFDPQNPNTIYARRYEDETELLFKSINGGATWSRANTGLENNYVSALAIDPSNANIIYAATIPDGVFKSTDGGGSWNRISNFYYPIALAIDPSNSKILYATSYDYDDSLTVFKSTDGGVNWSRSDGTTPFSSVSALVLDPVNPATLYVAASGYNLSPATIFKSTDSGGTWSTANTGLPSSDVSSVVIDPARPNNLYAGTFADGVFSSADGGATWISFNVGLTNLSIHALAIDASGNFLHAGTQAGVFDIQFAATSTVQLSAASYNASEDAGSVPITITRTGDTAGVTTVNYVTSDNGALHNCDVLDGAASARCDYATASGTVHFTAGQTSKSISIPIVDDSFAEGSENFTITLGNATGATLGSQNTATVTINDNEISNGPNPIDGTAFFVRQQYLDFLNREPDPVGYAAWQAVINGCAPGSTSCDRIHVSSSFFRSSEFQGRGYFVYRFYPVSFGRKPDYDEFTPDLAKVSGFLSDTELETAKVAFIAEFMSRPAFVATYNGLNNTQYVDTLLTTAQITSPNRDFWIAALGNGTRTRATVLRDISESPEVYNKYYNQAFVVMQYFGYLRRQPDAQYLDWIAVLDSTGDFRGMINGFMNSLEYRARFGP